MKRRFCAAIAALVAAIMLIAPCASVTAAENGYEAVVPRDCYTFGGNCYKFFSGSLTWQEASDFCESLGGHLATVTSEEEWQFLRAQAIGANSHCWLGGIDRNSNGNWEWVTGEPWSFTAWSHDFPNPVASAKYLYISYTRDYAWYNWDDTFDGLAKEGFICEWELIPEKYSSVVIPSSASEYNSHRYTVFPYSMSWHDAKRFCEALGGYLVTVTSEDEWNFVRSEAEKVGTHLWLGCTDEISEGTWSWVTGEEWSFSAWSEDFPNADTSADYAYISSTRNFAWYNWGNVLDNTTEGFICEWGSGCISSDGTEAHSWEDVQIIKEADCINAGEKVQMCTACGITENTVYGPVAHQFGEFEIISGSKLIPPIVKERTCRTCGHVETISDWSFVWIPAAAAVGAIVLLFGVINYIKAFKKS